MLAIRDVKKQLKKTLESEVSAIKMLSSQMRPIHSAISILSNRKGKIVITGVGKSAFIGMKIAATFTSLVNHAVFLHPVDALHGDSGIVADGDILIALSFSGESPEVIKIVRYLKKNFSVKVISITGNKASSLAKLSNSAIVSAVKEEGSPLNLAPMASTTAALAAGDLLASGLVSQKDFKEHHFAKFHPGGSLGLKLKKVSDFMVKGRLLPVVGENELLKKALTEITRKKKGVTAVVDNAGRIAGIITDGDVRRFFLLHDSLKGALAKEAMTRSPKIIGENESLRDALDVMEKWKITSLFVVAKAQRPVGLIHMHDCLSA